MENLQKQFRFMDNHRGWAGGVTLTKYIGTDSHVVVPGSNKTPGEAVAGIRSNCFKDCTDIESIEILPGIVDIGDSAFEGCKNLVKVTLPDTVRTIGKFAFRGCKKLQAITIPETVFELSPGMFEGCESLESLTWRSGFQETETLRAFLGLPRGCVLHGLEGYIPFAAGVTVEMKGCECESDEAAGTCDCENNVSANPANVCRVGSLLRFGSYPDASGEEKPLYWRIVEVKPDQIKVLCCRDIPYTPYEDAGRDDITYNFHYWLNDAFYLKAFTELEREAIRYAYFPETGNAYMLAEWGRRTYTMNRRGKISVLRAEEYEVLPEGLKNLIWQDAQESMLLRLDTHNGFCRQLRVSPDGTYASGYVSSRIGTIRPVLWLSLTAGSEDPDMVFSRIKEAKQKDIVKYVLFDRLLDPEDADRCILECAMAHRDEMFRAAIKNENIGVLKFLLDNGENGKAEAERLLSDYLAKKNVHVTAFLLDYIGNRDEDMSLDDEFEL